MDRHFILRILAALTANACLFMPTAGWPVERHEGRMGGYDEQRNFNTISSIYNLTVYPNQLPIFEVGAAGIPSGLFNQNVVGRVDPVGEFVGFQDSIEYFFALSPLPQANAASAAITGYQITEFTSGCAEVAASVVYLFSSVVKSCSPDNGKALAPLKQVSSEARSITNVCDDGCVD